MLISLQDITLQAGDRQFFAHTTWHIAANQHWAITGPTGSGKSILARAISRSISLVHGQILYFFDGPDKPEGRPFLYPREILTLSVETHRDFLNRYAGYHQARWQSLEGDDAPTAADLLTGRSIESYSPFQVIPPDLDEDGYRQKTQRWVDLLQIGYLLDRKVIHLSHGESRKLLIARLLIQSPRLLILDDPLAGLDQESRLVFTRAVDQLIKDGAVNVLLISSRSEELPQGISHILEVKAGRVIACGERSEVSEHGDSAKHSRQKSAEATPVSPPPGQFSPAFTEMVEGYARALQHDPILELPELIQMQDVSVHYGQVPVLQNITWTVRRGERWALLGKNGAGKTTLLSLILADNPQSYANPITLFGRRRGSGESIWEIKHSIGWVSPELQIYFRQATSLLDVVCSGFSDSAGFAQPYTSQQTGIAARWIEALGLDLSPETQFSSLSAGQQRLALLARALVKNPPLLILDEPCQALDEAHRAHFLHLLDRLCALTPLTLIYVTHLKGEIPSAITHQLRLEGGKIIA
jgi:molybdate transport system ATP-binding protein